MKKLFILSMLIIVLLTGCKDNTQGIGKDAFIPKEKIDNSNITTKE